MRFRMRKGEPIKVSKGKSPDAEMSNNDEWIPSWLDFVIAIAGDTSLKEPREGER